jgi:hypothetical protein
MDIIIFQYVYYSFQMQDIKNSTFSDTRKYVTHTLITCKSISRSSYSIYVIEVRTGIGKKSDWITRGIKVSRQRQKLLCLLKKQMSLPDHALKYIQKYQNIYRKVISVARQRENDRVINRSVNKSKTLW